MKKSIFFIVLSLMVPAVLKAQESAGATGKMWSYPVVYNYDEPVSWYFDLINTTFDENDVYIWIWEPTEPDAGNWANSSEFAKLTHIGNSIYRLDLTPTEYFGVGVEAFEGFPGFWHRLKDKNGTKQGDVGQFPQTNFSDFEGSGDLIRSYPERPVYNQPLSILFNSNLAPGFGNPQSVHMHAGLNGWEVVQEFQVWVPSVVEKTKLKHMGRGIYKMDLIPSEYFPTGDPDYPMQEMNFLFVEFKNGDWGATIPDQVLYAAEAEIPPPPVLYLFPMRISQKDILGIIRNHNERGVNALNYTISAGGRTLEGAFSGSMAEIKGFINLLDGFKGLTGIQEMHIVIEDNNGREILNTMIPLVELDQN